MTNKSKGHQGFVDTVVRDMEFINIADACRDVTGQIDPYKAAAIARSMGYTSNDDMDALGAILGSKGAFGDLHSANNSHDTYSDGDVYLYLPGRKPVRVYDSSKDCWGISMLKYILVIALCIGAFVIIIKYNPSDFGKIVCLSVAAVTSFLLLKNTDK